jgi:hypothetical protein
VAISVGVVSIAVGIGVPVFYETQIDNAVSSLPISPCSSMKKVGSLMPCSSMHAVKEGEYAAVLPVQRLWSAYVLIMPQPYN